MNEINKDELLDLTKWQRFFFMVLYSFAINGVVGVLIIIAAVQFFFYLFTSKINNQILSANNWLHGFFSDSLNFLSFNTDSKPWPFNGSNDAESKRWRNWVLEDLRLTQVLYRYYQLEIM